MPALGDERAVNNFREYLKIPSVHPKPDYDGCVYFLKKLAQEIGLKSTVMNIGQFHPVLILTLEGESPQLPSILLNSHMDVVPVAEQDWKYDPFSATVDEKGDIYGRGAQDMKCVTIGQLEAIRRLKESGVKLKRTIHMTVLPDEEIGSAKGMEKFVESKTFKNLNVGFDLDEGHVSPNENMYIVINESSRWEMNVHCPGKSGHGSLLHEDTAGEKVRVVIDNFMDFRKKQEVKLSGNQDLGLGDVTVVNLTMLTGGIQNNVTPPEIVVSIDMRVGADEDHDEMEKWIQDVCKKAGNGVYVEYMQKGSKINRSCSDDNPFFIALQGALKELGLPTKTVKVPGCTDARFVRKVGIPALGLTAFRNSPILLHSANEHLNTQEFLSGISYYEKIISALANC